MSQQKKLEQILDFLVNEEAEKAEELLHDLVVEKARNIYEELVNEEDDEQDEMDEEMDESIGGDMKQDFTGEIETARGNIQAEELQDGEVEVDVDGYDDEEEVEADGEFDFNADGVEDEHEEDHEDVGEKIDDLSAQIEELTAQFQAVMAGDEFEEPAFDAAPEDEFAVDGEVEMDFDAEPEVDEMYMGEATKLQDPVTDPGMSKEGNLAGTGKHSKTGATGTESPYTKAPTKSIDGAKPVDFTKGAAGGEQNGPAGGDSETAKDDTPSSNIDVTQKDVKNGEQTGEGDFVGTGKNSKKGAVNSKSPLSTAPKKP